MTDQSREQTAEMDARKKAHYEMRFNDLSRTLRIQGLPGGVADLIANMAVDIDKDREQSRMAARKALSTINAPVEENK